MSILSIDQSLRATAKSFEKVLRGRTCLCAELFSHYFTLIFPHCIAQGLVSVEKMNIENWSIKSKIGSNFHGILTLTHSDFHGMIIGLFGIDWAFYSLLQ